MNTLCYSDLKTEKPALQRYSAILDLTGIDLHNFELPGLIIHPSITYISKIP